MSEPETICYDCHQHKHLFLGQDCCVKCYYIRLAEQERQAELRRQDDLSRDVGGLSR